jgi:hypothetical protein
MFVLVVYGGVQHILCCVCLRLVGHELPVSLDCPFFISTSVFFNVYFSPLIINKEHMKLQMCHLFSRNLSTVHLNLTSTGCSGLKYALRICRMLNS